MGGTVRGLSPFWIEYYYYYYYVRDTTTSITT